MEKYFSPMCLMVTAVPEQGLMTSSTDHYPVDPVNPGFIMEPEY